MMGCDEERAELSGGLKQPRVTDMILYDFFCTVMVIIGILKRVYYVEFTFWSFLFRQKHLWRTTFFDFYTFSGLFYCISCFLLHFLCYF